MTLPAIAEFSAAEKSPAVRPGLEVLGEDA